LQFCDPIQGQRCYIISDNKTDVSLYAIRIVTESITTGTTVTTVNSPNSAAKLRESTDASQCL